MALESTQPLKEISTRNISWGKEGRCIGLTSLPPSYADYQEIWVIGPVQEMLLPYEIHVSIYQSSITITGTDALYRLNLYILRKLSISSDGLLTVHLCIILVINQLDAQNLVL